jgi:hypothetical protein
VARRAPDVQRTGRLMGGGHLTFEMLTALKKTFLEFFKR